MSTRAAASLRPLGDYALLIFDCDGVVLDSNAIKTDAFRQISEPFGATVSERFVEYHRDNGGISRHVKLRQLLRFAGIGDDSQMPALLDSFAAAVRDGLMRCPVAPRLNVLRSATSHATWAIASGGDQTELREVFADRELDDLFDGGIYGSPTPKPELVQRLVHNEAGDPPRALMLGDSRLDHEAADAAGIDFVFVSGWTDYDDWRSYVAEHNLPAVARIDDLLAARVC